jgi:hypothetical protein
MEDVFVTKLVYQSARLSCALSLCAVMGAVNVDRANGADQATLYLVGLITFVQRTYSLVRKC